MIEIIPALMPKTFTELRELTERFVGIVPIVQLDVMDGVFVPEKSWPYSEEKKELAELVRDHETMPFWEDIDFEADLMVSEPESEIRNWISFGAKRIIVHIESVKDMSFVIEELKGSIEGKQSTDTEHAVELGVALNIDTPNKALERCIGSIDFVQCMGIAKIGYQGQPFDERVISKIADLREQYPDVIISVDGGVNIESAPKLISAGANRLVSGSAILKSTDVEKTIQALRAAST